MTRSSNDPEIRPLTQMIVFVLLQLIIYLITRLWFVRSYLTNLASSNDDLSVTAVNDYYDGFLLIDILLYLPRFFIGDWGASWVSGQPILISAAPFVEKSILILIFSLMPGLILATLVLQVMKQVKQAHGYRLFSTYLPLALISMIFGLIYVFNRAELIFDGYLDRTWYDYLSTTVFLVTFLTISLALLLVRSTLLSNHWDDEISLGMALGKNLNYYFGLWIVLELLLNYPGLGRFFVSSILRHDLPLVLSLFTMFSLIYYLIMILSLSIRRRQSVDISKAGQSFEPGKLTLAGLVLGLVTIIILTLLGLLITDQNPGQSNLGIGSPDHPLGTTETGLDVLILTVESFEMIALISLFAVMLRLAIAFGVLKLNSIKPNVVTNLTTVVRHLPYFVLLPVSFMLLVVPAGLDSMGWILRYAVLSSIMLWYIPYQVLMVKFPTRLIQYSITALGVYLSVFVEFLLLGWIWDEPNSLPQVLLNVKGRDQFALILTIILIILTCLTTIFSDIGKNQSITSDAFI